MSQQSNSQSSFQSSSPEAPSSQSSFGLPTFDDNALACEPEILRAKSGERLWVVADTAECITLCKSQILVYLPFPQLIRRTNRPGSPLVSRRTELPLIGRSLPTVSMRRPALHMLSANYARPRSLTPAIQKRRTRPA